jgi:hypothetical protein
MNKLIILLFITTLAFTQYNKATGSSYIGLNLFADNYNINYTLQTSQNLEFVARASYMKTTEKPFTVEDLSFHSLFSYQAMNIEDFYLMPTVGFVFSYSNAHDILDNKIEEFIIATAIGIDFQYYIRSYLSLSLDFTQNIFLKSEIRNYLFNFSLGIDYKL